MSLSPTYISASTLLYALTLPLYPIQNLRDRFIEVSRCSSYSRHQPSWYAASVPPRKCYSTEGLDLIGEVYLDSYGKYTPTTSHPQATPPPSPAICHKALISEHGSSGSILCVRRDGRNVAFGCCKTRLREAIPKHTPSWELPLSWKVLLRGSPCTYLTLPVECK